MQTDHLVREATVNLELGRYPEARRDLEHVLSVEPGHLHALALLAETLRMQGDLAGADARLEPLLADASYRRFASRARAAIALTHAAQLRRENTVRSRPLAARRNDDALQWAFEAAQLDPSEPKAIMVLAEALHANGRTREGLAEAQRAVGLAVDDPVTHARALADLALLQMEHTSLHRVALANAKAAMSLNPGASDIAAALAAVQTRTGGHAHAMRTALDELRRAPTTTHLPRLARAAVFLLTSRLLGWGMFAAVVTNIVTMTIFDGEVTTLSSRVGGAIGLGALAIVAAFILFPLRDASVRDAVWRFTRGSVMTWVAVSVIAIAALLCVSSIITGIPLFFVAFGVLLVMLIVHWLTGGLQLKL